MTAVIPKRTEEVKAYFNEEMRKQYRREPLTSTSLYIIHTHEYDKPFNDRTQARIDNMKRLIINNIKTNVLNESNVFNRAFIDSLVSNNELSEYEYFISFRELIDSNDEVYKLCCRVINNQA